MRRLAIAAIAVAANAFSAVCLAANDIKLDEYYHFIDQTLTDLGPAILAVDPPETPKFGNTVTVTANLPIGLKIGRWLVAEDYSLDDILQWYELPGYTGGSNITFKIDNPPFKDQYGKSYYIALDLRHVEYKLIFDYNGGDGDIHSISGLTTTNGVTLPVPNERAGYSFDGVWTNASGVAFQSGTEIFPAEALGIRNADTSFTLYAKWSSNPFSIDYDLAGGSYGDEHPSSATFGEAFKVSAPTRKGYDFKGWTFANYDSSNARWGTSQDPAYTISAGSAYPSDGGDIWLKNLSTNSSPAVTMTATWEAKTYTANLIFSVASNTPTDFVVVTYDQPLPRITTIPVYATGADFLGYYTDESGGGVQFWDGEGKPNPAITWTNDVNGLNFYELKGNARRRVVFDGNGGTPSQESKMVTVGNQYGELPTASWVGDRYAFTGWFDNASGGNAISPTSKVSDGFGDINLYAHWAVSNYCVRFDGNGATGGAMDLQKIDFDVAAELSSNKYSMVGFSFAGWSVDGSATVTYADCAVVSNLSSTAGETNVLTAVWSTNTYYVAFDANGGAGTMATLTNLYGVAYEYPECTFTRNGFWEFSCWSNTVSGITNAPGATLSNLTGKNGETVVIKAVWSTTLSDLSQAMHCDNLQWSNQVSTAVGTVWTDEWGPNFGYNQSGSMVSQGNASYKSLQACVETNGTFKFKCRVDSGEAGTLLIWAAWDNGISYGGEGAFNKKQLDIDALSNENWQEISYNVETTGEPLYVNISNGTLNKKLCIDHMEWIPEGSDVPVEPGPGDEREFSTLECSGDSLFLSFPNADDRFSYVLRGTNDLVAPMPWPALFSTNGTGSITIETKILPGVPCMFYYLETTTK